MATTSSAPPQEHHHHHIEKEPRRTVWGRLLLALGVLGGAYTGVCYYAGSTAPASATVGGVQVGGLRAGEVAARLTQKLDAATAVFDVRLGDVVVAVSPQDLGLSVDVPACAAQVTGVDFHPSVVWAKLSGSAEFPVRTTVDRTRLEQGLRDVAAKVDRAVSEGSITIQGTRVISHPARSGLAVDVGGTADAIAAAWPQTEPIEGAVRLTRPTVAADEVARVVEEVADKVTSGPVLLRAGAARAQVSPAQLASSLRFARKGSTLALVVDPKTLAATLRARAPRLEYAGTDATLALRGGSVVVVPARPGQSVRAEKAATLIAAALQATGAKRTATLPVTAVPAATTTAIARGWNVRMLAGTTIAAPAGGGPARSANLARALARLNGLVLAPGKALSFNGRVGARTTSRGYEPTRAPSVITARDDDRGASQVASALFASAFSAGLDVGPRRGLTSYVAQYPLGLDARAVAGGSDVSFVNDTRVPVVIVARPSGTGVLVAIWGRGDQRVSVVTGSRTDVVAPGQLTDSGAECRATPGQAGFDIEVERVVRRAGEEVSSSRTQTHYEPRDAVRCTRPS